MTEEILHFIWKYAYQQFNGLKTSRGEVVEIISPGIHNFDSGPDFFNAKVKLDNTVWAGNVEIHLKSSDWEKHNHQVDATYDSIILHVVAKNDCEIKSSKGEPIPTFQIPYPDKLEWELQHLLSSNSWIPCSSEISKIDPFALQMWISALGIERFEQKTELVNQLVQQAEGSWEEAFYYATARSFGLKLNALPFEMMAKVTPLKVLSKVKNNLFQVEALLFGQSGLLGRVQHEEDEYSQSLLKEYEYQRKKFNLKPISGDMWKFMRLRPVSFPTIRIAQLAMLIHKSSGLFSKAMEIENADDIYRLLGVNVSDYWKTHYTFGRPSVEKSKALGEDTIRIITLNAIVPFMFAYGITRGNQELKDKALRLLEGLKPESNSVVTNFSSYGIKAKNALDSQALIQLKTQYCDRKKCLFCQVGKGILLRSIC